MSLGYAEKLSFIEDVGNVGMTEFFDSSHILQEKINQLAVMIQKSKHLVVFTGAGISTSCGIPDFRGPKGIWTLQKEGKAIPEASVSFHRATPSMTHMALVALEKAGFLKFVISQNIDGLHLRSGISREKLAELHGNSFMEVCPSCGAEYLRDFEVGTIGLKETSRRCSNTDCHAKLRDTVLDWEDALPDKEMNPAERHCKRADVVLCLGTSLQITPACNLPLKCLKGGGKIVIVNLQKTPKDKKASLVIHGLVDKVIAGVLDLLNLSIPPFVRIDLLQTILTQALSLDKKYVNWNLRVSSIHGNTAPLPFVESIEIISLPPNTDIYCELLEKTQSTIYRVSFSENQTMKAAILDKQPFNLKRRTIRTAKPFDILLKLSFGDGCKCLYAEIRIPVDFQASTNNFEGDKNSIFRKLKDRAMKDPSCGQTALIEKKAILVPKSEIMVHSIVTDIVEFRQAVKDSPRPSKCLLDRQNGDANEIKITRKRSRSRKRSSSSRRQV